jgi:aspartate aminotransferase-like enzyme
MLRKNRLFTPGPTPLHPHVQAALASADVHHRTADFRAVYKRVLTDLQTFIGTKNETLLLASSGSGAMEASVQNLTQTGDRVLVLSAGKFGERWRDLVKVYGCQTDLVSAAYGETFHVEQIRAALKSDTRAVFVQATESSTGARHDIAAIAKLLRGSETLLVVDAITGLGTTALDVDGWGVDIIIGGSQKALMAPPGVAYLAVSERAWRRMEQVKTPRYYFDLRKERKSAQKGESAFTPAIAIVAGLDAALQYLRQVGGGDLATGRDMLVRNAETCAAMTRAAAQALGMKLFAKSPAAALTAVVAPEGIDSGVVVKAVRDRFGAVLADGQGEMKGQLFRIAHIGYYDYLDTIGVLGAIEQVLASAGARVEFGAGVAAAQRVYAEMTSAVAPQAAAGK